MRTETLFYFSSFEHTGCRIYAPGGIADNVVVYAQRDLQHVHEVAGESIDVPGAVRVHGSLCGVTLNDFIPYSDTMLGGQQTTAFDIDVLTFNPENEKDYRLKVLDCWSTEYDCNCSDTKGVMRFHAGDIVRWHTDSVKSPKISLTAARESDQMREDNPTVRQFGDDTMHIGPWTTVRACLDCGVLITGGPTRCKCCVSQL